MTNTTLIELIEKHIYAVWKKQNKYNHHVISYV